MFCHQTHDGFEEFAGGQIRLEKCRTEAMTTVYLVYSTIEDISGTHPPKTNEGVWEKRGPFQKERIYSLPTINVSGGIC